VWCIGGEQQQANLPESKQAGQTLAVWMLSLCASQRDDLSADQRKVLEVMQRTFATYITEQPEAVSLKEKLNEAEAALAGARNKMKLGYTDPKTGDARNEFGGHNS
jgi:hypothetical protein